jgi:seryl-tRNA synthetase
MIRDTNLAQAVSYRDELVRHRLLIPTGARGVYGFGHDFDRVLQGFDAFITRAGQGDGADVIRFPTLLPRGDLESSGYLKSFPHLAGFVHAFAGDERSHTDMLRAVAHGGEWASTLSMTDVVLTPAACYPVYPTLRGLTLRSEGQTFDVLGVCFRQEPSDDPARMRMFRQREYVYVGEAERCRAHRDMWLERAQRMFQEVQLPAEAVVANDPFFGRTGRMLAASQREQALKFELVIPIASEDRPTACASCNYHQDSFGRAYEIRNARGSLAHSACIGFGLERVTLALFKHHGFSIAAWPVGVRATLGL